MNRLFFTFIIISLSATGCKTNTKEEKPTEKNRQEILKGTTDSPILKDSAETLQNKSDSAENNETQKNNSSIQLHLDELSENYKNVSNPFIATFDGFSLGDYPHLLFSDDEKTYDFGDGSNSYTGINEEEFLSEESSLIGKKFKIYWEWKISDFNCCNGEMESHSAKIPSITKLELIEK